MKYIICATEADAIARSSEEALNRGCSGTTTQWWGWREMADGRFALLVDDDSAGIKTEPKWKQTESL